MPTSATIQKQGLFATTLICDSDLQRGILGLAIGDHGIQTIRASAS